MTAHTPHLDLLNVSITQPLRVPHIPRFPRPRPRGQLGSPRSFVGSWDGREDRQARRKTPKNGPSKSYQNFWPIPVTTDGQNLVRKLQLLGSSTKRRSMQQTRNAEGAQRARSARWELLPSTRAGRPSCALPSAARRGRAAAKHHNQNSARRPTRQQHGTRTTTRQRKPLARPPALAPHRARHARHHQPAVYQPRRT